MALNGFILYSGVAAGLKASEPSPAYKAEDICPQNLTLRWKAGDYADMHDIYLGTDLNDVNESASPVDPCHDSNSWSVPATLELGTTYYWRIDEVNNTDVWTGDIWWFVTQTGKAYDPAPVDDERGTASGDTELSWSASCLASTHNVYFGTSWDDVNDATTSSPEYEDNVSQTSYTVSTDQFTVYYWRVDEVGAETVKGDVWAFRTGVGGVLMWYDFDGTQGNGLASPLADKTGSVEFTKHVDPNNPGSVEYAAPNPVYNSDTGTSADFQPGAGLRRIDPCTPTDLLRLDGYRYTVEMWVNMDIAPGDDDFVLVEKQPWSISINEDRFIEWWHGGDDDRYNVLEGVGNPLAVGEWYHVAVVFDFTVLPMLKLYIDGGLAATLNSSVNTSGEPLLNPANNTSTTHIGYGGDGDFFDGRIDELRVQDLALKPGHFLTVPGPEWASNPNPYNGERAVDPNAPDLKVTWTPGSNAGSHRVYMGTRYGDVEDVTTADAEYTDTVDVNHYPESNSLSVEYGKTYYWRIDEVNGVDVWKGMVWRFTTAYEIIDPNLRVWYGLDESEGVVAADYSGHGLDGDLDGAANWDPNNGRIDGCLIFDDDMAIQPLPGLLDGIGGAISISTWLYGMPQQSVRDNWLVDAGGAYDYLQVKVPDESGDVYFRAGSDTNDVLVWDRAGGADAKSWIGFWHHFAFVKDEIGGEISIYFDGELVDSNGIVDDTVSNLANKPFKIGAKLGRSADYEGKVDDLRIYDRALSPVDVQALFRGGDLEVAWAPDPYHGEANVPPDVNVTWKPGDYAAQHKVFFGESWEDVNSMTDPCAVQDACEYDPGTLELDTTYYWRIDEVNGPNTWKGPVWRFTVADFIVLDDFERYDYGDNRIYYTWYDQRSQDYPEATGSWLGLATPPTYPVHIGDKAMSYQFDNDDPWADLNYSEAWLPLDEIGGFQDWTSVDVRLLTVFFYGDADNDTNSTEQMYMGVMDTDGLYGEMRYGEHSGEAAGDLNVEEWQRWDVPFVWFTDNNSAAPNDVDFSSVASVRIGFGNRRNPAVGGAGVVYFDDLRLSMPFCKPEYGPTGDLNGDCFVGVADIGAMGDQWLRRDVNANPVTEPSDANLVARWKLDGDANDSSANAYHGTAEDSYAWVAGKDGQAIDLSGGWVVVEDDGNTPKLRPKHYVSVMAWIYIDGEVGEDEKVVIKGEDDEETFGLEADSGNGAVFIFRDANDPEDVLSVQSGGNVIAGNEWIHIAGTYDQNEQLVYVNGAVEDSNARGAVELFSDANDGLGIGGRYGDGADFEGKIDDVRVYDRAVTAAEIGYIACGSDGMCLLESEANLYSDEDPEIINFKDYATLFDYWGDENLWPPEPAP